MHARWLIRTQNFTPTRYYSTHLHAHAHEDTPPRHTSARTYFSKRTRARTNAQPHAPHAPTGSRCRVFSSGVRVWTAGGRRCIMPRNTASTTWRGCWLPTARTPPREPFTGPPSTHAAADVPLGVHSPRGCRRRAFSDPLINWGVVARTWIPCDRTAHRCVSQLCCQTYSATTGHTVPRVGCAGELRARTLGGTAAGARSTWRSKCVGPLLFDCCPRGPFFHRARCRLRGPTSP
jgi:hypothetical protein